MKEKDKERAEKEIENLKVHLELDKFNYDLAFNKFLVGMGILISALIGFFAIIFNLTELNSFIRFILSLVIFIFLSILGYNFKLKSYKELENHNKSFMAREKMIRDRYELLGINRKKMDEEFEKIKKDIN